MLGFELVEEFPYRPGSSFPGVFESLADSFSGISARSEVKQALIGFGVLHDRSRLAFHREHNRALALLQLLHEFARPPAESCKRMYVLGNIEHRMVPRAPF